MKKVISMGIASAVLALTAVAASAASVAVKAPEAVGAGDEVVFTVVTTEEIEDVQFTVEVEGLELVEADEHDSGAWDDDNMGFAIGVAKPLKVDTTLLTLTFTVTAEEGEDVSVKLVPSDEDYADVVDGDAVVVTVGEGNGDGENPGEDPGEDPENPPTGVALAIVPAVIAGAAVVVAKKRK